ncbi:Copper-exporting P-type ATPase [Candidatus Magnetaquicoccaceae bacterium FCR-1]|uniref:Copper-exporting P-type ATPase n=1 Tax=Candidatus Magnetaquiglobus chichijimensis TaxID=3141448 RepID=A0ABQ0C7L5_9PROT
MSKGCFHCGLEIPSNVSIQDEERAFCCTGCLGAWRLIHGLGLDEYYLRREGVAGTRPEENDRAALAPFDDSTYQNSLVAEVDGGREVCLLIDGIHCAACVWLNEQMLRRLPGVSDVWINFATHRARVRWNPDQTRLSEIIGTVRGIGYRAEPYDPTLGEKGRARRDRALLLRLGVAAFGAANVMFIAVALYAGYFQGMDREAKNFFHWVSLILATPVIFYSGSVFTRGAWNGLKLGRLTMDLPVALGAWVTYLYSVVVTLRGVGEVYFDSVTMFMFVLLTGRFLESIARGKAAGSMERLINLEPRQAVVLRDGESVTVPVRDVRVGDRVVIKPGERVPVDGSIESGVTSVDESMLTGESLPVTRGPGAMLVAGTQNLEGSVILMVERIGEETALARILRLVETAQAERPAIQGVADRVAARFIAIVLVLAGVTLGYWLWRDPSRALENSVAVLIITCPCALGLGAPAAMLVAMGAGARLGILLKNGETVERLERVTRVVMDKTGVLTLGLPRVERIVPLGDRDEREVLTLAAAVEQHSEHPVGRAIHRAFQTHGWPMPHQVVDARNVPGLGMEGVVDGHLARVGRLEFVVEGGEDLGQAPDDLKEACTWSACGVDGRLWGWIGLADAIKPHAREAVTALREAGLPVTMLSGDRRAVVEQVGAETGVEQAESALLPEGKEQRIAEMQQSGAVVAMVGDGVNDAPALARADVAMVVANATDLAVASADVILLNRELSTVPMVFTLARRTLQIIRQNYRFSLFYNLLAIPLAMAGWVSPIVAAIAMPLSSLVVVGNALRLRDLEKKK